MNMQDIVTVKLGNTSVEAEAIENDCVVLPNLKYITVFGKVYKVRWTKADAYILHKGQRYWVRGLLEVD